MKQDIFSLNQEVTMIIPIKASDFKYVEKLIPLAYKNIAPKQIVVISGKDVKEKCAELGVNFIDENKMVPGLNFDTVKQKLIDLHIDPKSTGWYLQQFLKLGFFSICKTRHYVSWDADMLPIRKINLFDENGKPFFTLKREYIRRYFLTLKRLLNLEKNRNESFIAEHMLFDVKLVKDLIEDIEKSSVHGKIWWEKILYATLPESQSGAYAFSEFETYGNWVTQKYPNAYALRRLNMCRHAKYFLGENPTHDIIKWAAKSFDTLSFEHFDTQIVPCSYVKIASKIMSFKHFLRISKFFFNRSIKNKLQEFDWFFGEKTQYEKASDNEKDLSDINKIKVLFDTTMINSFADKGRTRSGIYWVSFNILKKLASHPDIKLYLYSAEIEKTKAFIEYYAKEIPRLNLFFGDILNVDLYLSSFNQIPAVIKKTQIPCFTVIYDCIPFILPEHFEVCKGWWLDFIKSFTNQDYCFAISNHTKKDFLKYCPALDADKISLIPLSTNLPFKPNKNLPDGIRKKYNIPSDKKYLFSLCSLEPRKNLIRAVKCFIKFIEKNKIDDLVFVLGGGAYEGFIERFEKEVSSYNEYKDKIIRAGYVDDEDLEVLYSNAEWFVYTSRYEGFGMPPLEAMACGTAVITSNNSSLPEVVGDAGIMIDWDSDEQHIAAYEKYYFDKKYRDSMAKKGLERAKMFSWDSACDIIVNTFKKIEYNPNRTSLYLGANGANKQNRYYLFDCIPVIKTSSRYGVKRWLLFGFLPLIKQKRDDNYCKVYLFGFIPVIRISTKYNIYKLRVFGIPLIKIKH